MNKLELIDALKESHNLTKAEAIKCFNIFFDSMTDALANGDRVEIRGLCSIHVKEYEPYVARNPKTGEPVKVKSKKLPFFKAGTELKRRVDNHSKS